MRFKLLSGVDMCNRPPMNWRARGVLPHKGLAALYGPSGTGKSFLALDLAATIAGDANEWFGLPVEHCAVTYVCLEGEEGMGKRVKAWSRHHGKPLPDVLRFVTQSLNLLNGGDVSELAKAIRAAGGAGGVVIIDTLNRAVPGADENSSVDMGKIIAAAKQLQLLTDGLVLLVHHTGKDAAKGLRGHSSLYAALDAAIEVSGTNGSRSWKVAKSKDDEDGKAYPFTLQQVEVGSDEYGDITSCVVLPGVSCGTSQKHEQPRGANQKTAKNIIDGLLRESRSRYLDEATQKGHSSVLYDDVLACVSPQMPVDARHQKERAQEAITALVSKGLYRIEGEWLWRP